MSSARQIPRATASLPSPGGASLKCDRIDHRDPRVHGGLPAGRGLFRRRRACGPYRPDAAAHLVRLRVMLELLGAHAVIWGPL